MSTPKPGGSRRSVKPSRTPRRGRRPGPTTTREQILGAARHQFAEDGYDRTSIRAIATRAGVDPALVHRFFGSKQQLFVTVMELPFEAARMLPEIIAGPKKELGLRLARFFIGILESDEGRERMTGMVRAAASEPEAAQLLRKLLSEQLFAPLVAELGMPDAELRSNLIGSQMAGLIMARYIVAVEPLASLGSAELISWVGPTLQRYLTASAPIT